jgi:hypothetical protein
MMALDPTSREANVRDSVKRYFVENLYRTEGVQLTFDAGLSTPNVADLKAGVDKWVAIQFGEIDPNNMAEMTLDIYCCTRNDSEGFKLAQLRDKVMGYLTDGTRSDGLARIPFYRSYADRAWDLIGGLLVLTDTETRQMEGPDGTKYKMIPVNLRWGQKP